MENEEKNTKPEEEKVPQITAGTIARTIILILSLVNQFLLLFGKPLLKFNSAEITEIVANIWTICAALAAWWKNNSFTPAARIADVIMRALKAGKKSEDK